jgi:pyruvate/2-oxoglutarate dehydrogenase complex dihydrolipoamide acyltransferase (E2) component
VRMIGEPHTAAAGGTLHAWKVQKGQVVEAGQVLAIVRSATNGHYQVRASCAGAVRAILAPAGKKLAPGDVVCYVEAPSPPEAPLTAPAPRRSSYTNGNGQAPHPPTERPRENGIRLSTLPTVLLQQSPSAASAKPRRERVKLRGLYLLPSQERAIKRVVADLSLDEAAPLSVNDSELVRCALDAFLSMPPAAIRATVEAYKQKEKAAGVGAGWPRPGKPGKR